MRFKYSISDPSQSEFDSLPRVPLVLRHGGRTVQVVGLVDSGATINVLPFGLGLELGATWNDAQATISLVGNLGNFPSMPLLIAGEVGDLPPVKLAFAWSKSDDAPLILGQVNFFMEFDVCFYRSQLEFEVTPKSR